MIDKENEIENWSKPASPYGGGPLVGFNLRFRKQQRLKKPYHWKGADILLKSLVSV